MDDDIVRHYLADISRIARLSSSKEYRLSRAALTGDVGARRQLMEHHLGLVVLLARRYRGRGLPLLDLIEEGNLGLMTAIEKFDPEKGCRFSTYAKWWIRQSMEMALMTQTGVVRMPVHVMRAMKRHGVSSGWRFLLFDMRNLPPQPESDSEPEALMTRLAAPEEERPDWPLWVAGERRELEAAMARLKPTERLVLQARFGLAGSEPRTLQSIASQLALSGERVRQIQTEAIAKLRRLLSPPIPDR